MMKYYLFSKEDHETVNGVCFKALLDSAEPVDWIKQYTDLYMSCVLQPQGLPAIPLCYYQGQYFESIADFVALYERRAYPERYWSDEDYMSMDSFSDEVEE